MQAGDREVALGVGRLVVDARGGPRPHHVGCDSRADDRGAVLGAGAGGMGAMRVDAVAARRRPLVGEEAVLPPPAGPVDGVVGVDVEVAAEAVERIAGDGRGEPVDRAPS